MSKPDHRSTDPICVIYRPPRGWLAKRRFDRARGVACVPCMDQRAFEAEASYVIALAREHIQEMRRLN